MDVCESEAEKLMMHLYSLTETSLISMETFSLTSVGLFSLMLERVVDSEVRALVSVPLCSTALPAAQRCFTFSGF